MKSAAEGQDTGAKVERCVAAAVAPVDDHSVCVQGAGVVEGAAQRGRVVLIDRGGAETQLHVSGRDVVDRDIGSTAARGAVLVGDRDADGKAAAACWVVEVLVADAAKGHH